MPTTTWTDNGRTDSLSGAVNLKSSGGIAYKFLLIKSGASGTYDQTLSNVGTPGTGSPSTSNVGTDEVTSAGYTSGGFALTNGGVTISSHVAISTPSANPSWTGASFSAICGVMYTTDSTLGSANRTLAVFDFGGTQTVSSGTFTVVMPANTNTTALIRVA